LTAFLTTNFDVLGVVGKLLSLSIDQILSQIRTTIRSEVVSEMVAFRKVAGQMSWPGRIDFCLGRNPIFDMTYSDRFRRAESIFDGPRSIGLEIKKL
jgi:hypothetical protein